MILMNLLVLAFINNNSIMESDYLKANRILRRRDCGIRSNVRYSIFKPDLQKLANELGIEISQAHYPPYS